ncbi:NAD-dependent epimerase/dehydratase family protein [Hymenobacter busanensis]|uniref:NAD-dependent epimerase/dehydratase family protein n=1 Tax=Hymenobacter busanensis TaxID=2607656 RepID=A0A7L4ZRV1_9BACT|nr:NAD-dependent epimerase/dehydratase family protein [Hymenobacter busanensis]KAA9327265.1 NAD-dependent epimerase/dehydratase family protein [Hymenobacter busanensis]QHJ05929.1 NAD-dependent epimerase/dehydratase family protein [Hymenobacter busanensis]
MAQRVLVTGAGGFLGRHLVQQLLHQGYAVRALLHRPLTGAVGEPDFPASVECVLGDICRPETVAHAADGCWGIIHAAALAQVNPARNPAVWAVNHGGTATVLQLARQAAVQRFVYVGTANVFGFGTLTRPGNETHPFAGQCYGLDYMDSKRAATELVERAVREWQLPAVLVHPTFMLGPGDAKPTSNALVLELLRGTVPGYPAGGKNYVHVQDVAVAAVNALTQGRVGESYVLGHQNLTYRDAFRLIAGVLGVLPPRWPIPTSLARLYGTATLLGARLTGRPGRLNPAMVAVAADGHYFDAAKARAELSLPQTPIAQAVADAYDWFKMHRYV